MECYKAGDYKVDFNSGDLIQCYDFAPEKGTPNHLRSSCGTNPTTIPQPDFDAQQTAEFPFLGSMVNEGALPYDRMIIEIVFHAVRFRTPAAGVSGHSAGSFRGPSIRQDAAKLSWSTKRAGP